MSWLDALLIAEDWPWLAAGALLIVLVLGFVHAGRREHYEGEGE